MNYQINTGKEDIEKARENLQEGLKKVSEALPKETTLDVDVGWNSSDFVVNKMKGTSGKSYGPDRIRILFNSNAENWEKNIQGSAVHEYTHSWFYEKIGGLVEEEWRYILDEALTQNMTEKLVPEAEEPWRTKFSKEEIAEYWPKIKEEELDKKREGWPDPLFISRDDKGEYPNWLGYSLAYQIGKELLKEYTPEEIIKLRKEDVIEVGDRIFRKD